MNCVNLKLCLNKEIMFALNKRYFWISFLYFFSGLPLGLFYTFLPVYFRTKGIDLVKIGLLSSAGIFWSLKPIWAPILDRYFQKKTWIAIALWGLSFSLLGLKFSPLSSSSFVIFLFSLTFFSALLDTALDGFTIEWTPPEELGRVNGLRVSFYRIALIFSGGILTAVSQYLKFSFIFIFLACLTFLAGVLVFFHKDLEVNIKKEPVSFKEQYLLPLKDLFQRADFLLIFFIATYKAGDALLGGMVYPFWVDKGFSRVEIGLISGTLGSIFTILGSLIGGHYTSKWGLKKALIVLGLFQAFSNLFYGIAALPWVSRYFVYVASIVESFTGGLGTASFITFLTALCKKEFSSTQYAIFSTLFSFTMVLARSISGVGAKFLGYATFFFVTFFVALLPILLIPRVFRKIRFES